MIARILAATVLFCVVAGGVRAEAELVINTGTRSPYTTEDHKGFLDLVVAEMFRRIGLKARVQVYSGTARSLENSNTGLDDGEAMRIKGIEKKYSNLIPVPEKLIDNDFVAYSVQPGIEISGFESLRSYVVGYINGWRIFERNIGPEVDFTKVTGADQLTELLRLDRVDVILYERWQGLRNAKEKGIDVHAHEPPLAKRAMHIYLHKKHAALVPEVSAALAEMKRDGTYDRIVEETLHRLTR